MPRQSAVFLENNFRNGLISEATGLNFPENACTDIDNCELILDGSVKRRLGFDFEGAFSTKTINRTNSVVNTYLWKNVSGDGNVTVLVVQVGNTLHFYRIISDDSFSSGEVATTVTLVPVASAPTPETIEAQFSDGNGLLFVTHPYCEPMRIAYNIATNVATATNIIIKIRDFEGAIADTEAVDSRPTTTLAAMNDNHEYNLRNQGWTTINLTAWDTAQTTMPSNADIMWRFKDSLDNFDASTASINRITAGNTPAPKGHHILTLSNQNRDAAAGTTGVAATTTGFQRPSASAFFAGRLFYSGINTAGFNSNIYFTQIIERLEQYGFAHQVNDPTSEDLFDLLVSDGGVISIPEAGTIFKLFAVPGGLGVFAANGVWFITGSTGLGFTAVDYTVQKISNIVTISATSFVDVQGLPSWWNTDGIYVMVAQSGGLPTIQCITDNKIKSIFIDIPTESKRYARGTYHSTDGHIRWIYRSVGTSQITDQYEFDRVLNFNVHTGAFYPWSISASAVKVNAIIISEITAGAVSADIVTANAGVDTVIDGSGNTVITFSTTGSEISPFDKYLVSYPDGGSYEFTFAEKVNSDHVDWFQYDLVGINYDSYFVTGFKVRGDGIRKFQNNWVRVFSRIVEPVSYYFQGIWDFAATGSGTGRWSSRQYVNHTDTNYSTTSRRMKVRGNGLALQFRVDSIDGEPFDIIGWSALQTGNQAP